MKGWETSVYYKELASFDDFCSADSLAANWDGRHQASHMSSAYSTMTLQADSTIGFVYEEDTHRTNGGGYTIVYKNYNLEYLTDSLYSIRMEEGYADWIKACGKRKVEIISEQQTGDFVGMYDRQQLPLLKEAGAQCVPTLHLRRMNRFSRYHQDTALLWKTGQSICFKISCTRLKTLL